MSDAVTEPSRPLAPVPTLVEVSTLSAAAVAAALARLHAEQAQLAALEGALVDRLLALQAQPEPAADELLDMPTVARLLGIPESRARELGRRGELPTTRIGKYVRASRAAVETFMADKGLDRPGSRTLPSSQHASRRGQAPPQAARPYPVEVRRAGRGAPRDRQEVGGG